jgi:murein DD-endopeptidase MepM/ murein hydrolase activator NlpD
MVDSRKRSRKKTAGLAGPARPARRGTLRLVLVLGVLVLVNLYVFWWKKGTSLPEVKARAAQASIERPKDAAEGALPGTRNGPPTAAQLLAVAGVDTGHGVTVEDQVKRGDSLGRLLKRNGLSPAESDEVIRALHDVLDFKSLRPGQHVRLERGADGRVMRFELVESRTVRVQATRTPSGAMEGNKVQDPTRTELDEVGGRIDSSLYASIKAAGEDTQLVGFFVDVFAYDMDFYTDTHEGDSFKLVVEKVYKGQDFLHYGHILAAEYRGAAGTFRALRWQPPGAKEGRYFDDQGHALERTLLKTPLVFTRISSKFDLHRMHPILHRSRAHLGVDYAAPEGTPVRAAASGTIEARRPAGGAGNMIILKHGGGLETVYMHLSKFARGQHVGQHVDAKTVIGFVGHTGLATGPHLHFGVRRNGSYVNPQKLVPIRKRGVGRREMSRFLADVSGLESRLDHIAVPGAAPSGGDAVGLAKPAN